MKIPAGIADFGVIRREHYLYVDKTKYIEELESIGRYLFFIRPRRFGKTLFLSTLEHYYDAKRSSEFERLFSDLYIGAYPTEFKSRYLVLKLNFSGLNTTNFGELKKSFMEALVHHLVRFVRYYDKYLPDTERVIEELSCSDDPRALLDITFNSVVQTSHKVYLIVDEYDHFANDIIAMGDDDYYKDTIRAAGFVRDFYETVKIWTQGVIDRIFITGISPIMLDDMTSGFNIASNITIERVLNEMLGFTQEEMRDMIHQIGILDSAVDKETLMRTLKDYYNGYLFHERATQRVYNPDMVLYFLDQWLRYQEPPKTLIDDNVKVDYGRLQKLIANPENRELLEQIIEQEQIVADLVTRFSFERMNDTDYFVSLLFYLGFLTIDRQEQLQLFLKIPNFVIKSIFWDYFAQTLRQERQMNLRTEDLKKAVSALAYAGNVHPYLNFIRDKVLMVMSNRDLIRFDEKYLKLILFSFMIPTHVYKPHSEREVEGGYIDIFLEKDLRFLDVKYEWLWELKYLSKEDETQLERVRDAGLEQLKRYATSDKFRDHPNLKQVLIILIGKDRFEVFTP